MEPCREVDVHVSDHEGVGLLPLPGMTEPEVWNHEGVEWTSSAVRRLASEIFSAEKAGWLALSWLPGQEGALE
jgi:hypothetical protein